MVAEMPKAEENEVSLLTQNLESDVVSAVVS
jgi:hypothetical protein